jgi:hypothetical protein
MLKQFATLTLLFLVISQGFSQENESIKVTPTGSIDLFYGYDLNRPTETRRLPYLYNHNLHNQFGLNLGTLGVQLAHKKFTSRIIFQTGSYVIQNYADEPSMLRFIHEANVKCALGKNNRFGIEFGILPSHIGLESAVSFDNPTLTRSLVAENSPYYMNGLKVNYKLKDSLTMSLLALNGWQRIAKIEGNNLLSIGTQVNWQASKNFTLNWSSFIGTVYPDTSRKMRYYNNLFGIWSWSKKSSLYFGFDLGLEQKTKNSNTYSIWNSPFLIVDYLISDHLKIAARGEFFNDTDGIQIKPEGFNGANIWGTSLNLDYHFNDYLKFRIEGKMYFSDQDIFPKSNGINSNINTFICGSLALKF